MVFCGDRSLLDLGCCAGLSAFSWVKGRSAQTREPGNGIVRPPREMPTGPEGFTIKKPEKQELEKKVTCILEPHLVSLQATLTDELEGAMQRLLKAQGHARSSNTRKWKAVSGRDTLEVPANFVRSTSADQAPGQTGQEADLPKDEDLPMARRTCKRRWTTATGTIGGALSTAAVLRIGVAGLALEGDTPVASTVASAAASEVASECSEMSRRPSLKDNDSKSSRSKPRITFEGMEGTAANCESDGEENEDANPRSDKGSDTSSVAWRADALDVGQNLAAEAAAKKGTTSVESIVALVQVDRERWEEEKQALEARIEELKAQQRSLQATNQPDEEKEALKKEYQDLRKAMKARSRFGAWVCARHMMESEDEETDAEKEELRRKMSELSAKLRAAKAAAGAASSESDVSPSRRSPGPSIRRQ